MLRFSKLLLVPALLIGITVGCASAPPGPAYTPEQNRIAGLLQQIHLPQCAGALQRAALRVAGKPADRKLPDDQLCVLDIHPL